MDGVAPEHLPQVPDVNLDDVAIAVVVDGSVRGRFHQRPDVDHAPLGGVGPAPSPRPDGCGAPAPASRRAAPTTTTPAPTAGRRPLPQARRSVGTSRVPPRRTDQVARVVAGRVDEPLVKSAVAPADRLAARLADDDGRHRLAARHRVGALACDREGALAERALGPRLGQAGRQRRRGQLHRRQRREAGDGDDRAARLDGAGAMFSTEPPPSPGPALRPRRRAADGRGSSTPSVPAATSRAGERRRSRRCACSRRDPWRSGCA